MLKGLTIVLSNISAGWLQQKRFKSHRKYSISIYHSKTNGVEVPPGRYAIYFCRMYFPGGAEPVHTGIASSFE
jgi:hypothetical protein